MNDSAMAVAYHPTPWNKGKLIGQKPPLKLREIWALLTRLEIAGKTKELALFNLAIDSKLRGCDLVQLRVNDVARGGEVLTRASVVQQKAMHAIRCAAGQNLRLLLRAIAAFLRLDLRAVLGGFKSSRWLLRDPTRNHRAATVGLCTC